MIHLARWQRIAGWCGVAGVILIWTAILAPPDTPMDGDSAGEVANKISDGDIRWFWGLLMVGVALWLWFAAGVRERLSWGMGWSPLRAIGWAAATGAVVVWLALAAWQASLTTWQDTYNMSDEMIHAAWWSASGLWWAGTALAGLWLFASGLASVSWGGMPKWWGWGATVGGLALFVVSALGTEWAWPGFMFWSVWSLAGAVWLALWAKEPALPAVGTRADTSARATV